MPQQYYMVKDNRRIGPAAIESLLAQGLGADTLVWRVGLAQWVPAAQLPEVASLLPALPTPPPIPQTPPEIPLSALAAGPAPAAYAPASAAISEPAATIPQPVTTVAAGKKKPSFLSYLCLLFSVGIFFTFFFMNISEYKEYERYEEACEEYQEKQALYELGYLDTAPSRPWYYNRGAYTNYDREPVLAVLAPLSLITFLATLIVPAVRRRRLFAINLIFSCLALIVSMIAFGMYLTYS